MKSSIEEVQKKIQMDVDCEDKYKYVNNML